MSAAEIAQARLPGLPASKQRVLDRAGGDGWTKRRRSGRGGGFEYSVACLPSDAQLELALRGEQSAVSNQPDEDSVRPEARAGAERLDLNTLPAAARATAIARGEILAHWREYERNRKCPVDVAMTEFAGAYNSGELRVTDDTRALVKSLSAPNLKRWRKKFKHGGLGNLVDQRRLLEGPKRTIDKFQILRETSLAMIGRHGRLLRGSALWKAIHAKVALATPDELLKYGLCDAATGEVTIPSASAVRRFVAAWWRDNPSVGEAIHNPDRWKGKYRVKIAKADEGIIRLNQEWQIDGTPGDVLLTDGRYHILALVDVWSRRTMWRVARSESAHDAVRLITRAISEWGVPELVHGDNGAGFISHYCQRVLEDLGINYIASPPFRPETKPFIESAIHTMSHDLLRLLPGFAGHNVAQRQDIRARTSFAARFGAPAQKIFEIRLTSEELQQRLDDWALHVYGNASHSGGGISPNAKAAGWTGERREIADERALALIAEDAVERVLTREGISIAGARFVPTDGYENYVAHVGEPGLVFPDPAGDMGRYYVFTAGKSREFLCIVENCERAGLNRSEIAMLARQAQDRFIRDSKKEMKRIRDRIRPETVADSIIEAGRQSGTLSLPSPAEAAGEGQNVVHQTAALAAASLADAVGQTASEPSAPHADEILREGDAAIASIAERQRVRDIMLDDDELDVLWVGIRREQRALALREQRFLAHFGTDALAWAESYESTSGYRAMRRLERAAS